LKKIVVAGSTGSVGRQALAAARALSVTVAGLSGASNIKLLEEQAREFAPKFVLVADEKAGKDLKARVRDLDTKILCGPGAEAELVSAEIDMVINGVVGIGGLKTTLAAVKAGKRLALANKESLVVCGELVMNLAAEHAVQIFPVDSEHSAIFQCLLAGKKEEVKSLILTASGGALRGKTREFLKDVSVEQVLKHPNWQMGKKISVDSATLINKGFEILEAKWLFGVDLDKIRVVVHPQSVVHSMVEFIDNSIIAQMSVPDMTGVIAYALTFPQRTESVIAELDLVKIGSLDFEEVDHEVFKGIVLARKAASLGGLYPCILNGANEQLVEMFLDGRLRFCKIDEVLENCLDSASFKGVLLTEETLMQADGWAREFVLSCV
jgi:1-deoxy-D-xylulose-5-phosphate reductoisomerase